MAKKRQAKKAFAFDFATLNSYGQRDAMADFRDSQYPPVVPFDGEVFPDRPAAYVDAIAQENATVQREVNTADAFYRTKLSMMSGVEFGYFFCVVFVSDAQCYDFLRQSGWLRHTDGETLHVNGVALADELNIPLPYAYLAHVPREATKEGGGV